ncbi:exo-beta-1,3-glucanase [Gymnopilus junonius]|uniref:Exo-beta-1,3-glucanase n=1 Tax=Gymnopilus junonius TaxID=109634 RepID=A0A9P5NQN2_GYMJU|nr:exo-beta-1,3-glucanase [Gymnopilus junonius]
MSPPYPPPQPSAATTSTNDLGLFTDMTPSILKSPFKFLSPSSHQSTTSPMKSTTSPFWLENIKHQGISPFHDDSAGTRCSEMSRTYVISAPIVAYYYTQLIGDAKNPPTLLAAHSFDGMAVIDANPYIPGGGGAQYYQATNNFFRSIRNFVIDVRQYVDRLFASRSNFPDVLRFLRVPAHKSQGTGIHWQVAQATSLMNIVFELSAAPNTAHQGIWMENGSGGFMGDLIFNGGKFGIWGGNQQFTVRNITVNNAQTGVYSLWNWGWTYQDVKFNDCQVGFDIQTGGLTVDSQTTGAQAIIDAVVTNTPIFIRTSQPSNGSLAGSLVVNNAKLINVPIAVGVLDGPVVLSGTIPPVPFKIIESWAQGNVYEGSDAQARFVQGVLPPPQRPLSLLGPDGRIVSHGHPQYEDYDVNDFVSARDYGAVGDGVTDDTEALQALFSQFSSSKIIFLDAGFYIVSSTLTIPTGTRLVGEAWSVLAGQGPAFQDQSNPQVVFKIGEKGEQAHQNTEITDVIFTTVGPAAGAIVVEWNAREPEGVQGGAGMWDSHIRLAGSAGTNLDGSTCPKFGSDSYDNCFAAFMSLHITPQATGYFEGTWVWLADHDLDLEGEAQITAYAGRGILSESRGPVWMIGTASEHHVIYQYNLVGAKNHYMGLIQTESDSENILIFGAGLYSFFVSYKQDCISTRNCQAQIADIDTGSTNINIFSLSTVASTYQLSVEGTGIIDQKDNIDGFASTVTAWKSRW